jgi:hypoxanthine phosphoribosyltransferase
MNNGKKILIVDDAAELRQSLGEQLQLHEEFELEIAELLGDRQS